MKSNLKRLGMNITSVALLALPALAAAQYNNPTIPPIGGGNPPIQGGTGALNLLNTFAGWLSIGFWILAFVFILIAAFKYFTAAGDPEAVKEANQRLLWGVIAIAVGLMAYGARTFVQTLISGQ